MSTKQNDSYKESMLEKIASIEGVWYEGETIEEALERSEWSNKNLGYGSRFKICELLGYVEKQDGRFGTFVNCDECEDKKTCEYKDEMIDCPACSAG